MSQQFYSYVYMEEKWEHMFTQKLVKYVHSYNSHSSQMVEMTQMSITCSKDKQNVVCPCMEYEKLRDTNTSYDMNEPRKYNAK